MKVAKTVIRPPAIPHKMDVIPIHASDRGLFKRCRRRWNWSSPMRNNLVPKASEHGVVFPLWFGSGIHWALKHYYDPYLSRDPVETFQTWWDIVWNGGLVTEDWLEISYDHKPQEVLAQKGSWSLYEPDMYNAQKQYRVRGLRDILPDPDQDPFLEHRELGIEMMKFYKGYAEEFDDFAVLMAEHTFSVPVLDENGEVLEAIDLRDGKQKEVHIRGTQDAVIQELQYGRFGILEHKSAISISEDYFAKLDKDEQCTTYMYAAEREAEMYDLEYDKLDFVQYNALRKAFPKPPTEVRSGLFSIDRQKESTTPEMLDKFIRERGIQIVVESDPKLQAYVDYVNSIGYEQFIVRNLVTRNRAEIRSCGHRILAEVRDMLEDPRIYPNPTGDFMCLRCPFRAPCIAVDDGSDWQMMLGDLFEVAHNR